MDNELGVVQQEVRETVDEITELADKVEKSAGNLVEVINKIINRGIQTDWAYIVRDNLQKYHDNDMIEAIKDMQKQASKLIEVSDMSQSYSEERNI